MCFEVSFKSHQTCCFPNIVWKIIPHYWSSTETPSTKSLQPTGLCYNHDTNGANIYISSDILNGKITRNKIENAIRKAKNDKATGIDGLPLELISSNRLVFTPLLECLFNSIFESCTYPERWMDGVITPIFISGSRTDPENYRKVTVLPALGELFEIVLKFKNNVCSDNDPFQAGFKANSRTSDDIFVLYTLVQQYKRLKKTLYVCFIDFTKAFDYINQNALMFKRNVSGNFLNLIKRMFSK